jgi:hypothetical protein
VEKGSRGRSSAGMVMNLCPTAPLARRRGPRRPET